MLLSEILLCFTSYRKVAVCYNSNSHAPFSHGSLAICVFVCISIYFFVFLRLLCSKTSLSNENAIHIHKKYIVFTALFIDHIQSDRNEKGREMRQRRITKHSNWISVRFDDVFVLHMYETSSKTVEDKCVWQNLFCLLVLVFFPFLSRLKLPKSSHCRFKSNRTCARLFIWNFGCASTYFCACSNLLFFHVQQK